MAINQQEAMDLEKHLLLPKDWYDRVPAHIQIKASEAEGPAKVNGKRVQQIPVAIGKYKGWFILASGQGPHIIWSEWGG